MRSCGSRYLVGLWRKWAQSHEVMSWGSSQLPWRRGPIAPENVDLPEGEIAYGSDQGSGSLWGGFSASAQHEANERREVSSQEGFSWDVEGEGETPGAQSAIGVVVGQTGVATWVLSCVVVVVVLGLRCLFFGLCW